MFRFPLATSSWDQKEYDAINRVIESNRFSMGHEVAEFERSFADYLILNLQSWSTQVRLQSPDDCSFGLFE